jgi:hypothetical protein
MAKNRYFYNIAAYLFKLGTFGWQVKVDQSYCKSNEQTYKLIMLDKQDEVVDL